MSDIIDVLILNDAQKILVDHSTQATQATQPKQSQPSTSSSNSSSRCIPLKNGGRSYVYLLAPWKNVAQTGSASVQEAGFELQITVKVGDVMRYRIRNLALRRDFEAFIEQLTIASGMQCLTVPVPQRRPSGSTTLDASVATLDQVKPIPIVDSCWETTMTQSGMAALNLQFGIYDDKATHRGSFSFNPWITVRP